MKRRIVPDVINQQELYTIAPDMGVRDVACWMTEKKIAAVMVTENDRLVGIITERDMTARVIARGVDPQATKARDIMTANPDTLSPDDGAVTALEMMRSHGYRHLPVVDGEKLVGMVSLRDLYAIVQVELQDGIRELDSYIQGESYGVGPSPSV